MANNSNLVVKRAGLSPAKQVLLEKYLRGVTKDASPVTSIPRIGRQEAAVSFAQQRIWLLCQLAPDSPVYHMAYQVQLDGDLNQSNLEQSLNEILSRHEILRTTYRLTDGELIQQVLPPAHVQLPLIDISDLPLEEQERELAKSINGVARESFNLAIELPIRFKLIRRNQQQHVLLLTVHHIAFDGWSLGVFIREMAHLYTALKQGSVSSLPALPVQYSDFALWQRRVMQDEKLKNHLEYWVEKLAGYSPLQIPTDYSRPNEQSFNGANFTFLLPRELTQSLRERCLQQGVTVFSFCLAAFQLLLHRYSGQSDIVIGTVVANRDIPEIADSIGCLLNTLVIRNRIEGSNAFHTLLSRVHNNLLDAFAHRDLPFETLVDALHPERNLGLNPLFQIAIVFHNAPISSTLQLPGLAVSGSEIDLGITRFDMTLHLTETDEGLKGWFEYSTDIFCVDTIARWAGHWQTLLESIVAEPTARVSELALLTPVERRQLAAWNVSVPEPASDTLLHNLFETIAARMPNALAASHKEDSLSYAELDIKANRLAHTLRERGVGPEVMVGLCVETNLDMVVGMLGILKAGGTYVPIDPGYPAQRRSDILEDCGAPLLITSRLMEIEGGVAQFCLAREQFADQPETPPSTGISPDNAAYLIYTSGSTGRPKGVVVSHRNAVHSTLTRLQVYPQTLRGFLLLSSYAFDSSIAGIFWTLSLGGQLHILSDADRRDPFTLAGLIASQSISHLLCLPSLYGLLLEQSATKPLSGLDVVIVAGEECPASLAVEHYSRLPEVGLYNEYGPTEGTVWSSVHKVPPKDNKIVPIGRPIPGARIYLLDAHLNPVPIGVSGELYIGGYGISRGYHQRQALTAERFLPDPFAVAEGSRMYRTGDLARYREDGTIEFIGRIDNQVKLRGYRIELGEIKSRLLDHAEVKEAAVLLREDRPGEKRLVAYLVCESNDGIEIERVKDFLKQSLPGYMVPANFVILEHFPLSPNGKLDPRALPEPDIEEIQTKNYVAPSTEAEIFFAGLWEALLGLERVGIHDNFFALGGDSILAIQIVSRAREGGFIVTPSQLFQHQTVAELASAAAAGVAKPIEQGPISGDVPLTPIQCWFFEQSLPNPHHWNQAVLLEVEDGVTPDILERAIGKLVEHHDALRLRFIQENGHWRQFISEGILHPPLRRIALNDLADGEIAGRIEAECLHSQQSLNLCDGPLLQVTWFDLGQDRYPRLFIAIHHLIIDGVSWRILLDDLQTVCRQLEDGEPVALPYKTTSYQYWAESLLQLAKNESLQNEAAYWLEAIPSAIKPIPVDFPLGRNSESECAAVITELDAASTLALLRKASPVNRTEINDLLLAALVRVFATWTGGNVLMDLEGHGREDLFEEVDLSRTLGWFTTMFPVCFMLPQKADIADTIRFVKEKLRGIPRKGISYGLLRYLGNQSIAENLAKKPQPQILFNYLGQLNQERAGYFFRPSNNPIGAFRGTNGDRLYQLEINAHVIENKLRIEWSYSASQYLESTIQGLAEGYLTELRSLITYCSEPKESFLTPSDFPLAKLDQKQLQTLAKRFGN